jgi:hypothetical protein
MNHTDTFDHSRRTRRARTLGWLALLLIVSVALWLVLTPAWLIQPFRPQTPDNLALAYALRRWSPVATLCCLAAAALLCAWLWRGARRAWRKGVLVCAFVLVCATTWFARQNHFEWMFHPLSDPAYAKASAADFVADSDMVLAVKVGDEAVAYPVRLMAYHHLVADTVGGTPLVATY